MVLWKVVVLMNQNVKYITKAVLASIVTCAICVALLMSYKMPANNLNQDTDNYELYDEYYVDNDFDDDFDDTEYENSDVIEDEVFDAVDESLGMEAEEE